jgi:hypothetical protein
MNGERIRSIAKMMIERGLMPDDDDLQDELIKEGVEDESTSAQVISTMDDIIFGNEINETNSQIINQEIHDFIKQNIRN